ALPLTQDRRAPCLQHPRQVGHAKPNGARGHVGQGRAEPPVTDWRRSVSDDVTFGPRRHTSPLPESTPRSTPSARHGTSRVGRRSTRPARRAPVKMLFPLVFMKSHYLVHGRSGSNQPQRRPCHTNRLPTSPGGASPNLVRRHRPSWSPV